MTMLGSDLEIAASTLRRVSRTSEGYGHEEVSQLCEEMALALDKALANAEDRLLALVVAARIRDALEEVGWL